MKQVIHSLRPRRDEGAPQPALKPRRCADFFVVGAPRCGTTALSRYLGRHPAICFSKPKEPHYFSRLGSDWSPEQLERNYLQRYFPHLNAGHRLLGEGSVSYLYAPRALERIVEVNPDARMLVMLRNPLDMLPSYHLRMYYILAEDVPDFPSAWALQEERARGECVPPTCPDARLLLYREIASFGAQVEQLYRIAGRERCLVMLFDDFIRDPLAHYRRVLDFLGLEYDGRTEFPAKEPSRRFRYRLVQRLLWSPPKAVRGALEQAVIKTKQKKWPGRSLVKKLASWNTVESRPHPLPPEFREMLREEFRPDIRKLATLLGRDLSHWHSRS